MDDQKRDDKSTADERIQVFADKAADDEMSDAENEDTSGYGKSYAKKPDEDAGPDGMGARF